MIISVGNFLRNTYEILKINKKLSFSDFRRYSIGNFLRITYGTRIEGNIFEFLCRPIAPAPSVRLQFSIYVSPLFLTKPIPIKVAALSLSTWSSLSPNISIFSRNLPIWSLPNKQENWRSMSGAIVIGASSSWARALVKISPYTFSALVSRFLSASPS